MMDTYAWCLYTGGVPDSGLLPNATAGWNSMPEWTKVSINTIRTADGARIISFDVIQCHVGWTIALCIASAIMIIAALIPPITRHFCIQGSHLLLNFSSLAVRNNPYVAFPSTGTSMDASTRAKLSKNFRVQFGDVQADRDVGRLVIGSLDESGPQNTAYIRRERLYE